MYFTDCTFLSNSADGYGYGGAVWLDRSKGNVSITGCTFQNNTLAGRYGGAVRLYGSTGDVTITDCTFLSNIAGGYGYGGAVWLDRSKGNVSITGCNFRSNSARGTGGAVMSSGSTVDVSVIGCTFQNNSAGLGGGAVMLYGQIGNFTITDCTFHMNRGNVGGAICIEWFYGALHIEGILYSMFRNVSITNNIAVAGAAIYAVDLDAKNDQLTLQDVVVKDNHCSSGTCAGAIYFKGVNHHREPFLI